MPERRRKRNSGRRRLICNAHFVIWLPPIFEGVLFAVRIFTRLSAEYFFGLFLQNLLTFICRTAYAVGDAENRYQFNCEQNELSTEIGVDFHLTVTDTANPDREMNTPSRDQNSTVQTANSFNNRNTDAPQQSTTQPEIVSQPVKQQKKQLDLLSLLLDFIPVVLVGAVLFAVRRKRRH